MTASAPQELARRLAAQAPLDLAAALRPRGAVVSVADGVAHVVGLSGAGSEELVAFDSGATGMAYDLAPDRTGVVLLSDADRVAAGDGVRRHRPAAIAAGVLELLGRVVDPLGRPLDGGPAAGGRVAAGVPRGPRAARAGRGHPPAAHRRPGHRRGDPDRPRPAPAASSATATSARPRWPSTSSRRSEPAT